MIGELLENLALEAEDRGQNYQALVTEFVDEPLSLDPESRQKRERFIRAYYSKILGGSSDIKRRRAAYEATRKKCLQIYSQPYIQRGVDKAMESSIDFPRKSLSSEVWEQDEDGGYKMLPKVHDRIIEQLERYPDFNLVDAAHEIHVVGSICTNQYTDDADIDVHIVPNMDKLPKNRAPEIWVKDIFKWYKDNRGDESYIGEHPMEVYLQLIPDQDMMSDGVYNLLSDEWAKGPLIRNIEYDPYEAFSGVVQSIADVVGGADKLMGELRRDVVDYDAIKRAMTELPEPAKQKLRAKLQAKLKEVESDVELLMQNKKEWIDMRRSASRPESPEQALNDVGLAKKWADKNALFKLINRYGYMQAISDLEELMQDNGITPDEMSTIRGVMGAPQQKGGKHA